MIPGLTTILTGIGKAIGGAANAAFTAVAKSFASAADHFIAFLWASLASSTAVTLAGPGFTHILAITFTIALSVALLLFIVQIIASVLKRDSRGLSRALRGMVIAFIGGGVAIAVVDILLKLSDQLSTGIVKVGMGADLAHAGPKLLAATFLGGTTLGGALLLLLALGVIVATVIVWFALAIRKLLIVVTAVFAPVAFAGSIADVTAGWTKKWIEITLALIFSKVLLVIIFVTGWAMLIATAGKSGTGTVQTVTQYISGLLVLTLAGLAPWMALKIVHFTGSHMAEVGGLAAVGAAGGAMIASAPGKVAGHANTASSLAGHASKLGGSSGGGAAAGSGAAGGGAAAGAAATGVGIPVAAGMAAASAAHSAATSATEHVSAASDTAQGASGAPSSPGGGGTGAGSPPSTSGGTAPSPSPAGSGAPPPPPPPQDSPPPSPSPPEPQSRPPGASTSAQDSPPPAPPPPAKQADAGKD